MFFFKSKIQVPSIHFKQVMRTHIVEKIANPNHYQSIFISAPAGYGKTTAIVQGVNQCMLPVAWYTIDHNDNENNNFWKYVILALSNIIPGLEKEFNEILNANRAMPNHLIAAEFMDILQNWNEEYVLVLDDFHCMVNSEVIDHLALFLRYLPPNLHVIIASRCESKLLSKRLNIADKFMQIKMQDLRFTKEEVLDYCNLLEIKYEPHDIDNLLNGCEGWAAGLKMILASASEEREVGQLIYDSYEIRDQLADYFSQEVLGSLQENEVDFVLKTSILSTMTAPLCHAVTGCQDSIKMLSNLCKKNVLIEVIGADNEKFRYHHFFTAFLEGLLIERMGDAINELYQAAADWYENNNEIDIAFAYLQKGSNYQLIIAFIERNSSTKLRNGALTCLIAWMDCLPEPLLEESDMLCLIRAWVSVLAGQYHLLQRLLDTLEARMNDSKRNTTAGMRNKIKAEIAMIHAYRELQHQNLAASLEFIQKAESLSKGRLLFSGDINFNDGEIRMLEGSLGFYGRLSKVDTAMHALFLPAEKILGRFGYISILMGELLYERNQMSVAYSYFLQGLKEAMQSRIGGSAVSAVLAISRYRKARGDIAGAFKIVDVGQQWLSKYGMDHWESPLLAWKAWLSIELEDYQAAEEWVRKIGIEVEGVLEISRIFEYVIIARVMLIHQDILPCDILLSGLIALLEKEMRINYLIEVYNLKAIVCYHWEQEELALHYLRKSLELGLSEGYIRTFVEEGAPMAELLALFLTRNIREEETEKECLQVYAQKLRMLTSEYMLMRRKMNTGLGTKQEERSGLKEPLTNRELDVLKLMGQALSNQEIADQLHTSLQTVKFHASNIYRKLEVTKRQNAILKAIEWRII